MLQNLRCCWPLICVVGQHLEDDVLSVLTHVWDQFCDALKLSRWELQLHVRSYLLELVN